MYGLGTAKDRNIGAYAETISNVTLDGKPAENIKSTDSVRWAKFDGDIIIADDHSSFFSWASPGTGPLTPASFTTMAAKLNVQAYIGRVSDLDFTSPIQLNGHNTIKLVYI